MSTILYADCSVTYNGRAQSELERGNYILIFKPDGNVLVHGADLNTPLNYMGAGTDAKWWNGIDATTITCSKGKETLIITIYNIMDTVEAAGWSKHKIKLVRTEAELRDKLVANLPTYIPGYNFVRITPEAMTAFGPCDILAVDDTDCIHVIEVKRAQISTSSVTQLRKYVEALSSVSERAVIKGYVAAPSAIKSALTYCKKHGITYIPVEF